MQNFEQQVRTYYEPYYRDGDEAHLIDHADQVCALALKINKDLDEKLIILASYIHDMYNATNRKIHNELAYEYVLKAQDEFLKILNPKALREVAHAVLEHRASFKGEFYSKLSALISSADRGEPKLEEVVIRSMKFNKANAVDVYEHIKDKYGVKGYAKYPDVYLEVFKDELKVFQNRADKITVDEVLEVWKCKIA